MRRVCLVDAHLQSERLELHAPQPGDLAWQIEHLNTAAVMRNLGGVRSADAVTAGFEANAASLLRGEPGFWTVVRRSDQAVLGKCGLSIIATEAAPAALFGGVQIGWSLAEPFWGQGLASEAARLVIGHAFSELGQAVLWSQTSDSNHASSRMMARLGFARRAELDYVDPDYPPADNPTTVYRMTQGDWAERA
ncbi:MAG: GNAT family N-acetyltransferase [Novosphingobium sp.]|uniref:GNAT family N-acetyltransferase n=1 Tax=Novosphingobium sp. TaxID=1874826 RepID=UPI003C7DAD4F